ncbi:MAG: hypothetical protein JWM72_1440 [Actinomycetia bacterium]|nr:hypothetical protein [Actinomycetes bacterium]
MDAGCHFAGVNTWLMIRFLRAHKGPDAPAELLTAAGESRTVDELFDLATWSSYDQFRRLQLEECDSGQGFMFARPLAADAVEGFLADLPRPALPRPESAPTK